MERGFSKVIDLLYLAKQDGIQIVLNEERLQVKVPDGITIEKNLLQEIKENKDLIIDFLSNENLKSRKVNKNHTKISRFNREEVAEIPLSFSQERLWFIELLEGTVQYHLPVVLRLKGKLNIEALTNALQHVINRHEALRTVIGTEDGRGYQYIKNKNTWELSVVDGSRYDRSPEQLQHFIHALINEPFDLSKDHMIRAHLIQISTPENVLVITMHHIASDAWSVPILVEEVTALYTCFVENQPLRLPTLPIQYADYAQWQRQYLQGEVLDKKLQYWKNKLDGLTPLQLPTDFTRPAAVSIKGAAVEFTIGKQVSEQLSLLAKQQGATLFMTLLAALKVLLCRYSGQLDICVGSPVANRTHQEVQGLIGFFINSVALRSDLSDNLTFIALLNQVKASTLEAYEHQEVPFEKVVDAVVKDRDMSRSPLFQVMFVHENRPVVPSIRLRDVELLQEPFSPSTTKFELTFTIVETSDGLEGSIEYSTDLYAKETITRMAGHFKALLSSILKNPRQRIGSFSILTESEEHQLLHAFNKPQVEYPKNRTIIDFFEQQASDKPNNIALVLEDQALTYKELNERSNQLAHYLRKKNIKEDSLVPICIERSLEMIVGLLAILKAGGAYVPIDPDYPEDRISYMLEDTGASIVISSQECRTRIAAENNLEIVSIDEDLDVISNEPVVNLNIPVKPENLAYVIYTSGSTGKPKGVLIEHRNVVRLFETDSPLYNFTEADVWTMFHSFCFDFSVWEMYGALFYGGRVVIVPKEVTKDVSLFGKLLIKEKVTILNQTPSAFYVLQDNLVENVRAIPIRFVIFGGEALNPARLQPWKESYPHCSLINMYGITETTVHVTYQEITWQHIKSGRSVIGKPIPTLNAYILDAYQNLLPVGIAGELNIGGAGLARGYLNRPDLTEQRFIKNPFSKESGARIYRTGDLCRWLPDGNLEYLGRIDEQVKIRGYRIELGEIETVLHESSLVHQAIVLAKQDKEGNKRLVGYIVSEGTFQRDAVVSYLKSKLPEYMVPALWVELESLPLTSNGKINKKALPDPDASGLVKNEYIAPQTEEELKIAKIWQEVLNVERVGIHDNFFELGGDSIKVIRVVHKLRKVFNKEIKVFDIYHTTTLFELGKAIRSASEAKANTVFESIKGELALIKQSVIAALPDADQVEDIYPMSDIQSGMVYASLINPELAVYHDYFTYYIAKEVNIELFEKAILLLANKHSILRTAFNLDIHSEGLQVVYKTIPFKLEFINLEKESEEEGKRYIQQYVETERNRPFNLSKAPIWRSAIVRLQHHSAFIFQVHHALLDGWSVASFNTELNNLYLRLLVNPQLEVLSPLKASYKDFIIESIADKKNEENNIFWQREMLDYKRLNIFSQEPVSQKLNKTYPVEYLELLGKKSKQDGLSLKGVLFAAYLYSLSMLTPEDEITVGLVSNTRPLVEDADKLLGCFLNTIPCRVGTAHKNSIWKTYFEEIENKLIEFKQRDRTTLLQITALTGEKTLNENPFFDALFSFTNFHIYEEFEKGLVNPYSTSHEDDIFEDDSNDLSTNTYLNFIIFLTGNVLKVHYRLRQKLKSGKTLQELNRYFDQVLECYLYQYDQPINRSALLSSYDHQIFHDANDIQVAYPKEKTIVDLFEEQATKTPDEIAIVFEEHTITYKALNERSNQLAHYLRSRGVKEDTLVPLCVERSHEMMIGILGILKAGAAYVPIEPDFPEERKSFVLEDTGAKVVVSSTESASQLPALDDIDIIEIDDQWSAIRSQPVTNVQTDLRPGHLAYVIYTSGSTGKPKGAMIEHRNLVDYVFGLKQTIGVDECRSYALVSSIATDLGNTVIYSSLVFGGALHVFSKESVSNIEVLHSYFEDHRIDCLKIVPSHWKALSMQEKLLLPARILVLGGEAFQSELAENIRLSGSGCRVVNHYGPTETTIGKLLHVVKDDIKYNKTIPIGKPFSNSRVYVLSKDGALCPVGVPGELHIAGDGVGRGYLNNSELTAQKFIQDPFENQGSSLMYRTGDLVRYLSDGNIEFIGRVDDQVKIRGYRVELGEIESMLLQNEMVSQAVVLAKENGDGNKRLVGYVLGTEDFDKESLVSYLKEKLPDYMVPGQWVEMESFPLLPNGKIDRKSLPDPEIYEQLTGQYAAPRNEIESRLAAIWQDVLEVEQVGVHDDFFELGGHSLLAVRLISAIRKEFVVEMPIGDIFDHPTVALLALQLEKPSGATVLPAIQVASSRPERIPLSFSQERLWFIDQLEGSVQYHVPTILKLKGKLNTEALSYALQQIVNRHEVLRTVIVAEEGEAYQHIQAADGWKLSVIDGSKYKSDPDALKQFIQQLIGKPFDLSRDHLLRADLINIGDDQHILAITMHHIASDAWSTPILVKEVGELYSSFEENRYSQLATLPIQYADYAIWQRNYLEGTVLEKMLDYWKQKLRGVMPLQLPTDYPRPAVQSNRGAGINFRVDKKLSDQLQELSRQHGATLFMTLLSAYNILLQRYSGQQDICVGSPVANRTQQQVEGLLGFFINTLALRTEMSSDMFFTELLQKVKQTTIEAYEHQEVPFEKVVETVVKERDMSRSPLFQTMLVLRNTPGVPELRLGNLTFSDFSYEITTSKFDITFSLNEDSNGLQGFVQYRTDLYTEDTITRMTSHFKELLSSIVKRPQERIGSLWMLGKAEQEQLLSFNSSSVAYPKEKTIVDLFEEQATKTPDEIAIVFEEHVLTYKALNERSNQLAHYLRSRGVKEDTLVPLCVERSHEMMIGILGILKAGAAYVPIEPDFPEERKSFVLEDTGAKVVVSSTESASQLPALDDIDIIEIDDQWSAIRSQPVTNVQTDLRPGHLAYVIYTSGSTGKPKGAMIEHRNLVDYVFGLKQTIGVDECRSYALVSSIATDLGNTVIYSSLVFGGALHVFSKESVSNIEVLHSYFEDHRIDCLKIVPSHWKALSMQEKLLLPARILVLGGEAFQSELAENIRLSGSGCRVVNHYGPTETTIGKLLHVVKDDIKYNKTIPIGKPFSNSRVYVLSKDGALCPVGVPGELHIAGDGVGRGYLNNSELTAQKFIQDPFENQGSSLMYRTGDLVRYLSDGNIEFIGRVDDQVKIRGYRVELGEIESMLLQNEMVTQAVVLAKENGDGNKRLVGYVLGTEDFDKESLVSYLKEKLPDYMVPGLWVEMESFPLLPNGKIDRKSLPDPEMYEQLTGQYAAPRNQRESRLAAIWQDLLKIDQVGIHDNFFELGGHSLLAIRLISAIRKEFVVEMSIRDIFVYPTVALLAVQIHDQSDTTILPAIAVEPRPKNIPLSFSQERLWFIDQLEGSVQYHVPAVYRLKGDLDKDALSRALQDIVDRHEVLRTVILEEDGQPYQSIKEKTGWELAFVDGSTYAQDLEGLKKYLEQIIHEPFDLSKDYKIRAHLISLNENEHVLVVTLHHIASDGWSRYILANEVVKLYKWYVGGGEMPLAPLPIQYVDYAIWQRKYLEGEVLDSKLAYWKNKLQDVKVLRLPGDFARPEVQSAKGSAIDFVIDKELSQQLQKFSQQYGTTLFMTLLAAFKVLLYRYSGQQDICVGTAIAGRQQQEMENLIGFFVNTLALRSEVKGDDLFNEFLQQVKLTSMEAYEHQEVPFEKVVDAMIGKRDLGTDPLVQVLFALQNTPEIKGIHLGNVELSLEEVEGHKAFFELFLNMRETSLGLSGALQYATDIYSETTIKRMIRHFKTLLGSIVNTPQQKISELGMLTAEEERQLLYAFNNNAVAYPKDKSIADLFEQHVGKTPGAVALVFEDTQLTYQQLNERANQLAHYLRHKGVKEETLIPICIERSLELIIGILGILKAGAAYVPIDAEYPSERISFMLEDTSAAILVTTRESRLKLQVSGNVDLIELDTDWHTISNQPTGNVGINVLPHQLAYIIYTSGSTGKPKGVMVEHMNVVSLVKEVDYVSLSDRDILLSTGSPSFDATTFEYWAMLLNGGQLVVCNENTLLDGELLKQEIEKRKVTKMWFTSSWFNQLVETDISIFAHLDTILVGGEKLSEQHIKKMRQTYPLVKIVNGYGPTENTTFSLTYMITDIEENVSIPIGRPLNNRTAYILNDKHQLVPVNITGEIFLGGDGLARGYLNRPELTREKFIKNPLSSQHDSRLYRTGDLGRWLPDGRIEYLGRIDDQVKIRGYRIELGEIESVLNEIEYINSSCVVVKQDLIAAKRLVSYYIPKLEIIKAKERELYGRLITSWKELYETEYEKTETEEENVDVEFNIIGWNDSFTGKAIPEEDMREWLEDIMEVIMSQKPQHVLEIGSGTGLIYYQLAGKIKKYIGTDFSRSSMNQITKRISKGLRDYGPTELQVCAAHEVSIKEEETVDTIILNSIVQYFPGEDYMTDVIGKSISALKNNGRIIVGDVRDNRLLKLFKSRLYLKKMQPSSVVNEFKWAVEQDSIKEEELCFSPEYFFRLQSRFPQIAHIEIIWKNASYVNELSLYRYTVIIHVGREAVVNKPKWQDWKAGLDIQNILDQLQTGTAVVALKDVPNPRLVKERLLNTALATNTVKTVGDIVEFLENEDKESLDIEIVLNAAKAKGYHCRLLLDEDPLKMNVLIELNFSDGFIEQSYSENGLYHNIPSTNIPLFTDISSLLQKDLRSLLQQRLPEYMVPSEMIALLQLPLTRNGKVDRMFLSEREDKAFVSTMNYKPPATDVEEKLVNIWQDLLALERIGIHDNFFELGGHSLIATRMISAIRKQLELELSVKDLFLNPTIAELARHLGGSGEHLLLPSIELQTRPVQIPLSFSQERLWFIDQLEGTVQYHVPVVFSLKGKLNKDALEFALQMIVNRHEVLRTVILEQAGTPYQSVIDKDKWELQRIDGSMYNEDREGLQEYIQELILTPFDLSKDYMVRAHLAALGDEDHVLILTMHHIASDGWSMSVMVKEVAEMYRAYVEERPAQVSPLPIQYADYAIWQRNYLQGEILNKKLAYWKQKLEGVSPLQLPSDHQRPAIWSTRGSLKRFSIDKALSQQLQMLSQQQGTTLFMTLLTCFKVMLHRYSGQEDICVGSPIANRTQQEVEELIGFFVNTLALRSTVSDSASFIELLQQVRTTTMEAYEHQDVPFEKVVEVTVKERDLSRSPLFQVMFALQNIPDVPQLRLGDVTLIPKRMPHKTTKFDITVLVTETASGMDGSLEYATDLYSEGTINRMLVHFKELLGSIVKSPDQKIGLLPMITKEEERQLLFDFNRTEVEYPANRNIVDLFEEQAAKTPDAVAVVFQKDYLKYHQLNERSNQLAHYLKGKGLKEEGLVPICIERGPEMIIGILGILKAGGAYVPIDPQYPQERINYMLEDTSATIVITSKQSRSKIKAEIEAIEMDSDWASISDQPTRNLPIDIKPDHLAYVIYTSGSTGKPKGVLIEHRNVYAFICWCQQEFSDSTFEIVYASTSVCFDLSVFEIFYPLSTGRTMRVIEDGLHIEKYLSEDRSVLINSVPVVVESLLREAVDLSHVSVINMAGEPISLYVQQNLDVENIEVRNLYGPTEDTTYSTIFRLRAGIPVSIGKPISNTKVYILSKEGQIVPPGITGEICIGGSGVARGYLNRSSLTAEKFIADPFSDEIGARLYKTGDLGRWMPDGNIEYLGRMDNQVKIRGYRIELGEIENILEQNVAVSQAVVMAKADGFGTRRLVGYIVAKDGSFDNEVILTDLRTKLPDYMIPSLLVELERLPLTLNGKVDRNALPDPDSIELSGKEYVAPRNEAEEKLAIIWQELLGVERVGMNDNFFELGGHSLMATRVISAIRKELEVELAIKDLFHFTTISELSKYVEIQTNVFKKEKASTEYDLLNL